jgi:hypothetical protein
VSRQKKGPKKGIKAEAKRIIEARLTHPRTSVVFMGSQDLLTAQRLNQSLGLFREDQDYLTREVVYGSNAIFLALFMASASSRWCFAQLPEILLGVILPRSVVKYLSVRGSL